jgi:hypothetical protein
MLFVVCDTVCINAMTQNDVPEEDYRRLSRDSLGTFAGSIMNSVESQEGVDLSSLVARSQPRDVRKRSKIHSDFGGFIIPIGNTEQGCLRFVPVGSKLESCSAHFLKVELL